MKMRLVGLTVLLGIGLSVPLLRAVPTGATVSCHAIAATASGQGTTTTIQGGQNGDAQDAGLLQGATETGSFPTSSENYPPYVEFTGTDTITTGKGMLNESVIGLISLATGRFIAYGPVTDGTATFAGATGNLNYVGTEQLSTGSLTEQITGSICI